MRRAARHAAIAAALLAACAFAASPALADGDPASDILITERVFFPFRAEIPDASADELLDATEQAAEGGYPVRVALIAHNFDLGSVGILYEQPQTYAKFLAQELANFNTDWVLIVMPNGYGIYRCVPNERDGGFEDPCEGGEPTEADERALAALLTPEKSGQNFAAAGTEAVRTLAALHGTELSESSGGLGRTAILGGAAVLALGAALAGAFLLYPRWRRKS